MNWLVEATALLAAATIAVPLFRRFGLGDVLGYLAAGVAIGPYGFAATNSVESILEFSEIGIIFLLFIIGLELEASRLRVFRRLLFGLGTSQVVITAVVIAAAGRAFGLPLTEAVAIGGAFSLSSTAFALNLLAERGELMAPHGRAGFAVLLFQDLAVIPMLIGMPLLAEGANRSVGATELLAVGKAMALVAAYVVTARFVLRPFLRSIAASRNPEVFTAGALLLALGSGLLTKSLGLSMGLGAFLAGVTVADSEYRHQMEADLVPFKGLALGLFFMAVGMSADLGLLAREPVLILATTALLLALKAAVLGGLGRAFSLKAGEAVALALSLAQGGEFAFVLLTAGLTAEVVSERTHDIAVLVVTLSMAATPLMFQLKGLAGRNREPPPFDEIRDEAPQVIIAGFGRFGQIVGRMLTSRKIRFTALEASPAQVDFVRRFGNRIYYGDATRLDLLRSAGVGRAKAFVIAVDDMEASMRIAGEVIREYPQLRVYARARNRQHALRLRAVGAHAIVRETLPASLQLATDVLQGMGFSPEAASHTADVFRKHDEATLDRQFAVRSDEDALVQSARESARELEFLFEADAPDDSTRGSGP